MLFARLGLNVRNSDEDEEKLTWLTLCMISWRMAPTTTHAVEIRLLEWEDTSVECLLIIAKLLLQRFQFTAVNVDKLPLNPTWCGSWLIQYKCGIEEKKRYFKYIQSLPTVLYYENDQSHEHFDNFVRKADTNLWNQVCEIENHSVDTLWCEKMRMWRHELLQLL